jgi:hypothetical protein
MDEGSAFELSLPGLQAGFLSVDPTRPALEPTRNPVATNKAGVRITGPWSITFDPGIQPRLEHPCIPNFGSGRKVEKLGDWKTIGCPDRFSGLLEYAAAFECSDPTSFSFLDLGQVCHVAEVLLNGRPLGKRMWAPHRFELGEALLTGTNRLRIRVGNLIDNNYGELRPSGLLGPVELLSASSES